MDVIDLPPAMHRLMAAVSASCAVTSPEDLAVANAGAYAGACWLWGSTGSSPIEPIAREMDLAEFKTLYTTETDDRTWLDDWINPIFCDAWSTLTNAYRARQFPLRGPA
jgi:hypothetical protein